MNRNTEAFQDEAARTSGRTLFWTVLKVILTILVAFAGSASGYGTILEGSSLSVAMVVRVFASLEIEG